MAACFIFVFYIAKMTGLNLPFLLVELTRFELVTF